MLLERTAFIGQLSALLLLTSLSLRAAQGGQPELPEGTRTAVVSLVKATCPWFLPTAAEDIKPRILGYARSVDGTPVHCITGSVVDLRGPPDGDHRKPMPVFVCADNVGMFGVTFMLTADEGVLLPCGYYPRITILRQEFQDAPVLMVNSMMGSGIVRDLRHMVFQRAGRWYGCSLQPEMTLSPEPLGEMSLSKDGSELLAVQLLCSDGDTVRQLLTEVQPLKSVRTGSTTSSHPQRAAPADAQTRR